MADEGTDAEVRRSDQDAINEFGRLNLRRAELREDAAELAKRVELLADAEEDIMLAPTDEEGGSATGGAIKLFIGEAFFDADADTAQAFLEKELARARESKAEADGELSRIEARMGELKTTLYARFGKGINLEE